MSRSLLVVTLGLVLAMPMEAVDPKLLQKLEFRNIGPYRGGRSTAVTGVVGERDTFYMGTTGGGVWKTNDGGQRWTPVSDESFGAASIGAVAVAASDPNVVYAGTGSACPRGSACSRTRVRSRPRRWCSTRTTGRAASSGTAVG